MSQPHALQQFLGHVYLFFPRLSRSWRNRDANRVTDAFAQKHRERCGTRNNTLGTAARFRQAQMQRPGRER